MEETETDGRDPLKFSWVYVLRRESHASMCKVGFTSVSAKSRALEYTDGEWIVFAEYSVPNWLAKDVEKEAHLQLSKYWLDPKLTGGSATEVFLCEPELAEIAIQIAQEKKRVDAALSLGFPLEIAREVLLKKKPTSEVSPAFSALEESNQNLRKLLRIVELKDLRSARMNDLDLMNDSDLRRINQEQKLRIEALEKTIVAFHNAANAESAFKFQVSNNTKALPPYCDTFDVTSQTDRIKLPVQRSQYTQSFKPAELASSSNTVGRFISRIYRGFFGKSVD
jgi:T5orf172 domain